MIIKLALALISSATISNAATIVEHEWHNISGNNGSVIVEFLHDGSSVTFNGVIHQSLGDYFLGATDTGLKFLMYDGVEVVGVGGNKPTKDNPFGWGHFRRDYYYRYLGFDGILVNTLETSIEPKCYGINLFTNKPCPATDSNIYNYYLHQDLGTVRGTWTPNLPFIAPVAPIPLSASAPFMVLGLLSLLRLRMFQKKEASKYKARLSSS